MATATKPLTLGGLTFDIPELAIEDLAVVVPTTLSLAGMNPSSPEYFQKMLTVISVGVRAAKPDMTDAQVRKLPGSLRDFNLAFSVVNAQAGLENTPAEGDEAADGAAPLAQLNPPTTTE